jgi:hypothetical protein
MKEIILPKSKSETGGELQTGWEKYVIPDSMSQKEELKLYPEFISRLSTKIQDVEIKLDEVSKKTKEYDEKLREQTNKNIEIIGIFSAVLALLIIDVSIIKSVNSFLQAILLILALTCSIAIFAILIHIFFIPSDKTKFSKIIFWIPFVILFVLILLGILAQFFNWSWNNWVQK